MNQTKLKFLSFQEKASSWQFTKIWHHKSFDDDKSKAEIVAEMPDMGIYLTAKKRMEKYRNRDMLPEHKFMYIEPLLNANQEQHMFRKYNYFKYHFKKLINETTKVNSSTINSLEHYYEEACKAKQQLVYSNARLVMNRVKAICFNVSFREQSISDGYFGLVCAVDYFDWRKTNKKTKKPLRFSTYAYLVINDQVRKLKLKEEKNLLHTTEVADLFSIQDDIEIVETDYKALVTQCLEQADERERQLICLRFGLEGQRPHTLDELGVIMNISKERVRQIEQRYLGKVKESGVVKYEKIL